MFTEEQIGFIRGYSVYKKALAEKEAERANGTYKGLGYTFSALESEIAKAVKQLKIYGVSQEEADAYLAEHPL